MFVLVQKVVAMPVVFCPTCGSQILATPEIAGKKIKCPQCERLLTVPRAGAEEHELPPRQASGRQVTVLGIDEKNCVECGEAMRANAEICPHCGVRQPSLGTDLYHSLASSIKGPLLISALFNLIAAISFVVFSACSFVPLAIPPAILAAFEINLLTKLGSMSSGQLARKAKGIGFAEIAIGLFCFFNLPTLVCGILNVLNASKVSPRSV